MTVGTKIKRIRELFGKTQEEIATKLNITHQAYSRLERGETSIDTDRLEQIAQVLGISVEDIYRFDEKKLVISGNTNNGEAKENSLHFTLTINEECNIKLVNSLEKTIQQQKDEIDFLRNQVQELTKRIK